MILFSYSLHTFCDLGYIWCDLELPKISKRKVPQKSLEIFFRAVDSSTMSSSCSRLQMLLLQTGSFSKCLWLLNPFERFSCMMVLRSNQLKLIRIRLRLNDEIYTVEIERRRRKTSVGHIHTWLLTKLKLLLLQNNSIAYLHGKYTFSIQKSSHIFALTE